MRKCLMKAHIHINHCSHESFKFFFYTLFRSTVPLSSGYRRLYNHMITLNFKKVLRPHWLVLSLATDTKTGCKFMFTVFRNDIFKNGNGSVYDENKIKSAKYMHDIEDGLLR